MMKSPAPIQEATHFITLMSYSAPSIAKLIDHTLLRPEATRDDILRLCREARVVSWETFGELTAE